jgi:predicted metal-dependent enzyme (double-stranded beta helix superfamily)
MHAHPALRRHAWLDRLTTLPHVVDDRGLAALTAELAELTDAWRTVVRHDPVRRWYELIFQNRAVEVWLIGWAPGQWTAPHDHGGADGAFTVLEGTLTEEVYVGDGRPPRWVAANRHGEGAVVGFGPHYVHAVGNDANRNATSVHAYSPPDRSMRYLGPHQGLATADRR